MQIVNLPSNLYIKSSVFSYHLHSSYRDIARDAMIQCSEMPPPDYCHGRTIETELHSIRQREGRQRRGLFRLAFSTDRFLLCNRSSCATRARRQDMRSGGYSLHHTPNFDFRRAPADTSFVFIDRYVRIRYVRLLRCPTDARVVRFNVTTGSCYVAL
jgi:hypothetical protein